MLPISQDYMFSSKGMMTDENSLFPTYSNILNMILGIAFTFETLSTILGFAVLQKVGVPLMQNINVIKMSKLYVGCYISGVLALFLILAATFIM